MKSYLALLVICAAAAAAAAKPMHHTMVPEPVSVAEDRVIIGYTYQLPEHHAAQGWTVLSKPKVSREGMMRALMGEKAHQLKSLSESNAQNTLSSEHLEHEVDEDEMIKFRVLLKHDDGVRDQIKKQAEMLSHPDSPKYGQWRTQSQVRSTVTNAKRVRRVTKFLAAHGITDVTSHGDALTVAARAGAVQRTFACQLHRFSHRDEPHRRVVRALGTVSLPASLSKDVEFVAGLTEFIRATRTGHKHPLSVYTPRRSDGYGAHCSGCAQMKPQVLRQYYNVSAALHGPGLGSPISQAVGAFGETYSPAALKEFGKSVAKSSYLPFQMSQNVGPWNVSTDEGEGDLDVQYVLGMGQNVESLFWACDNWILEWTLDVEGSHDAPLVHSLSYGTGIESQCAIAQSWCNYLGYNSSAYVGRTNLEFLKLGHRGVTVLVSSGDNGCIGRGNNGHAPLDTSEYCPMGGCSSTTTTCAALELAIQKEEFRIECVLPLGMQSFGCQAVMQSLGVTSLGDLFQFTQSTLNTLGVSAQWEVDVEGMPHLASNVACSKIYYTDRLDFSNFTMEGFVFDPTEEHVGSSFTAEYPGISPYVLSVGASTITDVSQPEQAGSILNGGIITSGGGFSIHEDQPSYQQKFVQLYLKNLPSKQTPPKQMFDPTRRATPDVTLSGERYITIGQLPNGTLVGELVSGTSASSPALAGMLSLINAELYRAGKTPGLGWINPTIYTMYAKYPNNFNDITVGNIRCTHAYCGIYGWSAAPGWDPASGLGSPKFDKWLSYFMSISADRK